MAVREINLNTLATKTELATTNANVSRVDPGTAGTKRQMLRIVGGIPRWMTEPMFYADDFLISHPANPLQAMVDESRENLTAGVGGALLQLGEGEYLPPTSLTFNRWSGIFRGVGRGKSPAYPSDPGHASVVRWNGPADEPIALFTDCRDVLVEDIRFEGKTGAIPSYALEFRGRTADVTGNNRYLTVRNVGISRYSWSSQGGGSIAGDVKRGIGFTGDDGDNDQSLLDDVWIGTTTEYGLYVPNSQSVGIEARSVRIFNPGTAAVLAGTSIKFSNLVILTYPLAFDVIGSGTVEVDGYTLETGDKLARLSAAGRLLMTGAGYVQCFATISNADADPTNAAKGVLVQASPLHNGGFWWINGRLDGNTDPSRCRIEIGPVSPSVGNFDIKVEDLRGGHPGQVRMAPGAGMWATTPMSRGTVEWTSTGNPTGTAITDASKRYRFRNELRNSAHPLIGSGARTTLDKTVWDQPIRDHATTITASMTPDSTNDFLDANATAGAITISLPTAVGRKGRWHIVRKTDASANGVIIDPSGAETIGGAATKTITSQNGFLEFHSDGANWQIDAQGGTIT